MRFAFIRAEKAAFPIAAMCRLLGVTRQGYYAYAHRPPSARVRSDAELCAVIRELFAETREAYGSPRMLRELRRRGWRVGKQRVERCMRSMGLTPPAPPQRVRTTITDPAHPVAPNELARDFKATRPNERWVTDITYVWTDEGWVYLAVILDLFSRRVGGLGDQSERGSPPGPRPRWTWLSPTAAPPRGWCTTRIEAAPTPAAIIARPWTPEASNAA